MIRNDAFYRYSEAGLLVYAFILSYGCSLLVFGQPHGVLCSVSLVGVGGICEGAGIL